MSEACRDTKRPVLNLDTDEATQNVVAVGTECVRNCALILGSLRLLMPQRSRFHHIVWAMEMKGSPTNSKSDYRPWQKVMRY